MPTGTRAGLGNETFDVIINVLCTFPTLGANASGTNTQSVPGTQVGDVYSWNMQSPPAHLVLDNVYVSAPGTITTLWSSDSTGISTSTVTVLFEVIRPENASQGISALPNNVL